MNYISRKILAAIYAFAQEYFREIDNTEHANNEARLPTPLQYTLRCPPFASSPVKIIKNVRY